MSNNIIVTENFKNISQICPIKKIQYYNSEIILIVQTNDILEILLFFKNHFLCQFKWDQMFIQIVNYLGGSFKE